MAGDSAKLAHSVAYLAKKRRAELSKKERKRKAEEGGGPGGGRGGSTQRKKLEDGGHQKDAAKWPAVQDVVREACSQYDAETAHWRREKGVDEWDELMAPVRAARQQRALEKREAAKRKIAEMRRARAGGA
jgi:hypothetical protein